MMTRDCIHIITARGGVFQMHEVVVLLLHEVVVLLLHEVVTA